MIISNFQKCKKRNYICVIIFLTAQHHDQTQTSIFGGSTCQIAGRNINNLRYTDDITLMAESEKDLKSLLMRVKEENENTAVKFNIIKKLRSSSFMLMFDREQQNSVKQMSFN